MPEFQIDLGTSAKEFRALDSFTQGYIEAMFFTESGDDRELDGKTFDDLHPDTLQSIIKECAEFQTSFAELLERACSQDKVAYDIERAGNDFWYTRNGHGVGFWDRGLDDIGDELTEMSKSYGECDVYIGDDGFAHIG